jgi:hypothetical protein
MVPDKLACAFVEFGAMAFQQHDPIRGLAEAACRRANERRGDLHLTTSHWNVPA